MKNYLCHTLLVCSLLAPLLLWSEEQVNPLKLCVTISGENGSGSGFLLRHRGKLYVATNNHVVLELRNPVIKGINGKAIPFKQVLSAPDRDVALIPVEPAISQTALELEEHVDDIWPNEPLTCLGDSEGMGVIVFCAGKFLGLGATALETDAPFVPGNSGGPIIRDKSQKVVGVATYMTRLSNAKWAEGTRFENIKGNAVRRFATRLDNLDWEALVVLDQSEIHDAQTALTPIVLKLEEGGTGPEWELIQVYLMAKHGDAEARYVLGLFFAYGEEYEEAVKWSRIAAEQGHAKAQCNLGGMYANGRGVPKDYREAVKWYRMAAEQGDAVAQYNLGVAYDNGQGVPQDYAEAVKWYRKAADQGDAGAQYNLGNSYYNGRGVPQDYAEAVKWYRMAAGQGYVHAQYNLGIMYVNGQGVPKDYREAVRWYHKAAEQGYAKAQYNLGVAYANGRGVPKDYREAVKWYRKAADQGDAGAQCNLGIMYVNGRGVPQDSAEAVEWFRMAAEQGHAQAQCCLGIMYEHGEGVPQDAKEAVKWYRKAAEQGIAKAQEALRRLGQ